MNKLILTLTRRELLRFKLTLCFALLVAVAILSGCQSVPPGTELAINTPDGTNIIGSVSYPIATNANLVVTGGGNTNTGNWTAGVAIVFKQAPNEFTVAKLKAAGAVPMTTKSKPADVKAVWVILSADKLNAAQQEAVAIAQMIPGTQVRHFNP